MLKADSPGRYTLGLFLPGVSLVRVEQHLDGSASAPADRLPTWLDGGTVPLSACDMTATLKSDEKGRYALGRFLPRKPEVQVETHPDGSVTLRPVKRRMTRAEAEAYVKRYAGTWDGPISGAELLKLTRGA